MIFLGHNRNLWFLENLESTEKNNWFVVVLLLKVVLGEKVHCLLTSQYYYSTESSIKLSWWLATNIKPVRINFFLKSQCCWFLKEPLTTYFVLWSTLSVGALVGWELKGAWHDKHHDPVILLELVELGFSTQFFPLKFRKILRLKEMLGDLLKYKAPIWCFKTTPIKISPVWKMLWLSTLMYIYLIYKSLNYCASSRRIPWKTRIEKRK